MDRECRGAARRLLLIALMVAGTLFAAAAVAAEVPQPIAHFTFDENWTDGGGAKAAVLEGSPSLSTRTAFEGGSLYLNGSSALNVTAADGSMLLKNITNANGMTVSYYSLVDKPTANWVFFAAPHANPQPYMAERYVAAFEVWDTVVAERYHMGRYENSPEYVAVTPITPPVWKHVVVVYEPDEVKVYVDGTPAASVTNNADLAAILAPDPQSVLYIGKANWGAGEYYQGYIDELMFFDSALNAEQVAALEPSTFNGVVLNFANSNIEGRSSTSFKDMTIDGSVGQRLRAAVPFANGAATITLPDDAALTGGFRLYGGETAAHTVRQSTAKYPCKLCGWYNIATGEYHDVSAGPVSVRIENTNANVFYADWSARSYNLHQPAFASSEIATADTSSFIRMKVFDYNELVNLPASNVSQNGLASEMWIADNTVGNGELLFNDDADTDACWAVGTLGNPKDRTGKNVYTDNTTPGIVTDEKILTNLFDTNSSHPGVRYLGKGNHLFSYDAATGKYSYYSNLNAAVYQQSEERFYVYDQPQMHDQKWDYRGPAFLPLNAYNSATAFNNGTSNYWFGLSTEISFWLPDDSGSYNANKIKGENMTFEFSGDDDIWIFVDDELVLDLGGIHHEALGSIDFSTGTVTVADPTTKTTTKHFQAGSHVLRVYYMERGGNGSNCKITFNLVPGWAAEEIEADAVSVQKLWDGPVLVDHVEVELREKNGPAIGTAVLVRDNGWRHTWTGLDTGKEYEIREVDLPGYYLMTVSQPKQSDYHDYWVPADASAIRTLNNGQVLLGNGKGKLLHALTLEAVDVQGPNTGDKNILCPVEDMTTAAWTPERVSGSAAHFYLKNASGSYLTFDGGAIALTPGIAGAAKLYFSAAGELQSADADTPYRLVYGNGGFALAQRKEAIETRATEERVHLYAKQTVLTDEYSFLLTNTYYELPATGDKTAVGQLCMLMVLCAAAIVLLGRRVMRRGA